MVEIIGEAVQAGRYRCWARTHPARTAAFEALADRRSAKAETLADEICSGAELMVQASEALPR